MTASLKRSLRSPATMCPAPATSTSRAWGTSSSSCRAPSSLSRSLDAPRTSSVGTVICAGGGLQALLVHERSSGMPSIPPVLCAGQHELRVPVPVPAAVVVLAQVLAQPGEVLRARPVGVVGGDRVGGLLERGEPVEALAHERAGCARRPSARCAGRRRRARAPLAIGSADSPTASRLAMPPSDAPTSAGRSSVRGDRDDVAGEALERVVAVGRPVAVAVAAQVDGIACQPWRRAAGRAVPGVARLAAAVEQHHRRVGGVAELVGDQGQAVAHLDAHRANLSSPPGRRRTGGDVAVTARRTSRSPAPTCSRSSSSGHGSAWTSSVCDPSPNQAGRSGSGPRCADPRRTHVDPSTHTSTHFQPVVAPGDRL